MSKNKDRPSGPVEQQSVVGNIENIACSPEYTGLMKDDEQAADEFICPACCCGIYDEVKEESD